MQRARYQELVALESARRYAAGFQGHLILMVGGRTNIPSLMPWLTWTRAKSFAKLVQGLELHHVLITFHVILQSPSGSAMPVSVTIDIPTGKQLVVSLESFDVIRTEKLYFPQWQMLRAALDGAKPSSAFLYTDLYVEDGLDSTRLTSKA